MRPRLFVLYSACCQLALLQLMPAAKKLPNELYWPSESSLNLTNSCQGLATYVHWNTCSSGHRTTRLRL